MAKLKTIISRSSYQIKNTNEEINKKAWVKMWLCGELGNKMWEDVMKNKNAQNWELGKNNAYKRDFWGVKNPDFWGTKKKKKSPHIIWEQATTWGDTVNPNLIWGAKQNKTNKKTNKTSVRWSSNDERSRQKKQTNKKNVLLPKHELRGSFW